MRRLFGFLAVVLIPATTLFAQHHGGGSSSSSSGSSSSSSSSPSYSPPSYSPPSYSPPSSSGSSHSSDSGSRSSDSGSRSYDSGSRGSSSSSSSSGSSYPSSSHSGSESSSRSSSTSNSGPAYHSSPTNNSSGYSNTGTVHDSHNGAQIQNRHEFPSSIPSKDPESKTFHGTEQPASRGTIPSNNNRADVNFGRTGQASSASRLPIDPQLMHKYAPQEWKIQDKRNQLDSESNKLYTKYKLAGKDAEYDRKQAKLDEKRNKLLDKEQKLVKKYQLDAEKKYKPCTGAHCPGVCPPGSMSTHRGGCVASPSGNQNPPCSAGYHQNGSQCVQDHECLSGFQWNGSQCINEAYNSSNSYGGNCNEYYARLIDQKKILNDLKQSQASACTGNSMGTECYNYTQQVTMAETIYRQLESEYTQCLLRRRN